MGLSITNPIHISQQELTALVNCNLSKELIAVQKDSQGSSKIVTVLKSDVTCWQLFLRFFGAGKLAKTHIRLAEEVIPHLGKYDWSIGATLGSNSIYYRAYIRVLGLSLIALNPKSNQTLFRNVDALTRADLFKSFRASDSTTQSSR